ncbi:MAG: hypothetical protein ACOYM8_11570 [Caulobacterales bacterium]|jgi:alkyl sulfatase BDS1-like metallo-beta-lactamase superfamily hydrolase
MQDSGSALSVRSLFIGIWALARGLTTTVAAAAETPAAKPAAEATRAAQAAALRAIATEDERDFEFARRGFIATP